MINDVIVEKLKIIEDPKGKLMHMLRCDSPLFSVFGEIYFSTIKSGAIKAWRKHLKMTQNFAVPAGKVKLVIYDDREKSSTKGQVMEVEIGDNNYSLVKIPPMIWYGFKGVSAAPAVIANCSDIPHDPDEIQRLDAFDPLIPYAWQ